MPVHLAMPLVFGCLLLAGCGDRGRPDAFSFHGMTPGMNATDLRAAATGLGVGAMSCSPFHIEGVAADLLCFTPDSSASTVNVSAMVQSADSMVSYLAIREFMTEPGTAYDALSRLWGAPDTTIETGRQWQRGRWTATADTGENILTIWISDTTTAHLVALASQQAQLAAIGADTLPYTTDAVAVVEMLRADSVGHPAPQLAAELTERPTVLGCDRVAPPASLSGRSGSVLLAYVVDTLGRVEPNSVRVLEASHRGFAPPAAASVRSCRLTPGRKNGQAVRTLVQQRVTFDVKR
ncbi:MAG TPA: energy transducer TonB [Gemmatimonadales bacterium]|nr:energy transducer TonB [Gemmatimonadales bacterium]